MTLEAKWVDVEAKNPSGIGLVWELHKHAVEGSCVDKSSEFALEDGSVVGARVTDMDHFVEKNNLSHLPECDETAIDSDTNGETIHDLCYPRSILRVVEGQNDIGELGIEVSLIEDIIPTP